MTAAAIGERLTVEGYALAGAVVYPADSHDEANAAFDALAARTVLVVVTAAAAAWLEGRLSERPDLLTVVMEP